MSMEIQPSAESENTVRSMPEMGFIIAFCEKFKPLFKGFEFWPEELEGALATEADSDLIDQVHCIFLTNCLNRTKPVSRQVWRKLLSETIDQKLKKSYQFYRDYNPLRRVKNYYELDIRDKVLILNNLVTWQLQEGKEVRKLIEQEYRSSKRNEGNSLVVEPFGEDRRGRKFYYFGYGARVYRETIVSHKSNKSKKFIWDVISTTLEDLENYINDSKELKSATGKDKALYNKFTKDLIPVIKLSIEAKERRIARKLRQEKLAQRVALLHANSEVIASRTRSGTRRAIGLDPDKKSTSNLSSASSTKSRYDEDYTYSAGPHMTRARAARESAKRKYIDDDDADSQDSTGHQSTRSTRSTQSSLASKIAKISTNDDSQQASDDLSSLSNEISIDFRIDGDEITFSSQEKIGEPMSRSVSNISQTSSTSKLSREIFGTDSVTSVSEKAGDDDYKEVFGSDDGTELSEPEEALGSDSGSDYQPKDEEYAASDHEINPDDDADSE
ncbi:12056_t:CDS:2 [Dentiscutata erythropus]|uniref:12056_t:CDS:1 n=1 Tax=Dentiscutata erythropus TaxID=1348616 RepID=A0A9N9EJ83_9GLOM|nr:12056_t:CDS:2 [Dentiscutata erythropus]